MAPAANPTIPTSPVHAAQRTVWAVIPTFARRHDVVALLSDLSRLALPPGVRLRALVIDNASPEPLDGLPSSQGPTGVAVTVVRLDRNRGGSGGFSAGVAVALAHVRTADDLVWLLDSDVRVEREALTGLVAALDESPDVVAVGSALVDPRTGLIFEVGGRIDRRTGELRQFTLSDLPWNGLRPRRVEYVAACSVLVRRRAAEVAGVMPDVFLSGDDAMWCLRLARATGGKIACAPASRAHHPHPDRMRTIARYYAARNAMAVLDEADCGRRARFIRAMRETLRAVGQSMVARDDFSAMHLAGLRDALEGRVSGAAERHSIAFEPWQPLDSLGDALAALEAGRRPLSCVVCIEPTLRERIEPALSRLQTPPRIDVRREDSMAVRPWLAMLRTLLGGATDIAIVSARGRSADWRSARTIVSVCEAGFVVRGVTRVGRAWSAGLTLARGATLACGLGVRGRAIMPPTPTLTEPLNWVRSVAGVRLVAPTPIAPSLSIVIVSFNRRVALHRTLAGLERDAVAAGAEIIVVDNASGDGSADLVRSLFPRVRIIESRENTGIAAFNTGAQAATGDVLLILDDDALPAHGVLAQAMDLLSRRADIAGVALHPRNTATHESEWPFAEQFGGGIEFWPVMGCGNLVRRDAWLRAGGYTREYFLYRNDVDFALTLLGLGMRVYFDPAWEVSHDTIITRRKSMRWCELATRNWVWMCRRHGRGAGGGIAAIAGWAWAHRLAALSITRHASVLKGAYHGLTRRPPSPPDGLKRDGRALAALMRVRFTK